MRGVIVALAVAACGRSGPCEGPVVFAASDLGPALQEIAALRAASTGCRPVVATGASGALAAQVAHGAPADLFLSADAGFVDALAAAGTVRATTRTVYAHGHLALVAAPGRSPPASLGALAEPGWRTVAIANPEHAPYGRAAAEALRAAGLWEVLQPRLVFGENVAQTWQLVASGNADAGLVARSVAVARGAAVTPVDAPPLVQVGAVTTHAADAEGAGALLRWLVGPEGRAVLARHGFGPP
jgi:molybdate transport system substrate-binding protein